MGGMTSLLLLLWIGVTVSTAVDLQKRIQKGYDCPNTERLYHVKLNSDFSGNLRCGGSMISNQWILTAAHCWQWDLEVVVGVHPGTTFTSIKVLAPPVMYGDDQNRIHDIMLLKLPEPTDFKHKIDLPDCDTTPSPPEEVQLAGFGFHSDEAAPKKLQCADFKLDKGVDCQRQYFHVFCSSSATGSHSCPGDSGGAAVHQGKVYGVVISYVMGSCTTPVFTDVCKYIKWIRDTTGIH